MLGDRDVLVKSYERRLRFILVGCGKCGAQIGRMALDQGFECVAAVTNKTGLGQDLGEFLGLGKSLGVTITDDLDAALEHVSEAGGADLAFEQTNVYPLDALKPILLKLLSAKLNVASIREELFFSWDVAPVLSAELDAAAKANGVSLVGGGFCDPYWSHMMLSLIGTAHRVKRCGFLLRCNIDMFGEALVKKFGMGMTPQEWEEKNQVPFGPVRVMHALADAMGWGREKAKVDSKNRAHTVTDRPVPSEAIGRDIQVGEVYQVHQDVLMTCENGVEIAFTYIMQILREEEEEENEIWIEGYPSARVTFGGVDTMDGTISGMLGRAMATVNASPGYIPFFKLGAMRDLF